MLLKGLSKAMGLMVVLLGLWLALTVVGFAGLIDPAVPEPEWWAEYRARLADNLGGIGIGLAMAAVGGWLVVVPPGRDDEG